MNNVKCRHVYAVPHKVVVRKIVEEVDEAGFPCQRYENVNLLTSQQLESVPYTRYSLESQVASNQPIKRINTVNLEPTELGPSHMAQLEYAFEKAKLEVETN